jgi:CheY-like chemotaxis protein
MQLRGIETRRYQYISRQAGALGLLLKLGYSADIAANGLAVLEALKSIPYDIILMDCLMPEMDGYETAQAIRTREQSSDQGSNGELPVHIIAITANAMQGDRQKCLAAGMDDYLSKPIRLQELEAVLERWKPGRQKRSDPTQIPKFGFNEDPIHFGSNLIR